MAYVPITPSVLEWALREARLDVSSLAQATGISAGRVSEFLQAETLPTKGELDSIAKATRRSWHVFLLPKPPQVDEEAPPSFRGRLEQTETEADVQARAVREARRLQRLARWALKDPEVRELPKFSLDDEPAAAAVALRGLLGWSMSLQRELTKSQGFRHLRTQVEALGPIVVLLPAGSRACRGFTLHDARVPLIFVNSDFKGPAVRTFTIVHEMAHLLLGPTDILCDYGSTPEERWCNAVASSFLLPPGAVERYMNQAELPFATESDLTAVQRVANYFRVSWYAAAIKLRQLGLGDESAIQEVRENANLELDGGFARGGRTSAQIRIDEFGRRLPAALFSAYDEQRLPKLELGRLLHADSNQLADLRLEIEA